jgi:hypothetical protein
VVAGEGNGFLNKCIRFLLEVHKVRKGGPINAGLEIELSGDNAFYSQRDKVIFSSLMCSIPTGNLLYSLWLHMNLKPCL